jgi:hypothetical protein
VFEESVSTLLSLALLGPVTRSNVTREIVHDVDPMGGEVCV